MENRMSADAARDCAEKIVLGAQRLNKLYCIYVITLFASAIIPILSTSGSIFTIQSPDPDLILFGSGFGLANIVIGIMLLYSYWEIIQIDKPRTTPLSAVVYLFIPLFNIYWLYVAIVGLARDMNTSIRKRDVSTKPISIVQAWLCVALILATVVPLWALLGYAGEIGLLIGVMSLIVFPVFHRSLINATLRLMQVI